MFISFNGKRPEINGNVFIAENSSIIGDVRIDKDANIWFGAVIRADGNYVEIGKGTNIQDNCVIHINPNEGPTVIGDYVTVGHGAIIHGAKIGHCSLIGMGAIILDGAEIGNNTIVGAGSLVPQGKKIEEGVLCLGSPAKVIRRLSQEEINKLKTSAENYILLAEKYKDMKENKDV